MGAVMRYFFSLKIDSASFPYATLAVNVIGCFIMGVASAYFIKISTTNDNLKLLILTGTLGGFTTFSAFSLDTIYMIEKNLYLTALSYILLSVILSLLSVVLGIFLVNKFL